MSNRCLGCGKELGPEPEYAMKLREGHFEVQENNHTGAPLPTFIRQPHSDEDKQLFTFSGVFLCWTCAQKALAAIGWASPPEDVNHE